MALPLLRSPLIPEEFVHGFTWRAGGVSVAPFDSLNVGMKWGDARENVLENRRRVLEASGARVMHFASQVHGARVAHVSGEDDPAQTALVKGDAVCSDSPGVAVAIFVADCTPLLFADVRTGAFAALHAGWRGTIAGVVDATIATMATRYGSRPADLRAALGPCIGACCFEVGQEVADAFALAFADAPGIVLAQAGRKPHVDLRAAQRFQLLRAGVATDAIDVSADCTHCDPAGRFFSYRRDRGSTGQHLAFITRRA